MNMINPVNIGGSGGGGGSPVGVSTFVTAINGATGPIQVAAVGGASLSISGNTFTISAPPYPGVSTFVGSFNGATGAVTFGVGVSTFVSSINGNTNAITFAATGGNSLSISGNTFTLFGAGAAVGVSTFVSAVSGLTGALTLAGSGVSIVASGSTITFAVPAAGAFTSIGVTGTAFFATVNSPLTADGTIGITFGTTPLANVNGGTGTSLTQFLMNSAGTNASLMYTTKWITIGASYLADRPLLIVHGQASGAVLRSTDVTQPNSIRFMDNSAGASYSSYFGIQNNVGSGLSNCGQTFGMIFYNQTAVSFTFHTSGNSTPRVIIQGASGWLGCGGMTNPLAPLEVNGAFRMRGASNFVQFKSFATGTTGVAYILPDADGTSGQVMQTDGAGNLTWVTRVAL